MYLVVLYIFIRWKGRVTIIVTITFLRKYARYAQLLSRSLHIALRPTSTDCCYYNGEESVATRTSDGQSECFCTVSVSISEFCVVSDGVFTLSDPILILLLLLICALKECTVMLSESDTLSESGIGNANAHRLRGAMGLED